MSKKIQITKPVNIESPSSQANVLSNSQVLPGPQESLSLQARELQQTNESNRTELFGRVIPTSTPTVGTVHHELDIKLQPILFELAQLKEIMVVQNGTMVQTLTAVENGFSSADNNNAVARETLKNFRKDCMGALHNLSAQLEETRRRCRLDTLEGILECISQLAVFLWRFLIILKQILVFIHFSAMAWADFAGICPIIGQWATSGIKLLIYLTECLIITLMLNAIGILFGISTLGETALQKMAFIFCEVISALFKLFYNMSSLLLRVPNALMRGFTESSLGQILNDIKQSLMTWLYTLYKLILTDITGALVEQLPKMPNMKFWGGNNNPDEMSNLYEMPNTYKNNLYEMPNTYKNNPYENKLKNKTYRYKPSSKSKSHNKKHSIKAQSLSKLKLGLYGATTNDSTLTFNAFIKKYNIHDSSDKMVNYINTLKSKSTINLLKKLSKSEINTYMNLFKIINNGVNTVEVTTFYIFDLIGVIFENFEEINKVELVNSNSLENIPKIPEVRDILCNFII